MSSILNDAFAMLFSDFLYKNYVVGTRLNRLICRGNSNEYPQHMIL